MENLLSETPYKFKKSYGGAKFSLLLLLVILVCDLY
jgi:hypothetical protein